MFVLPENVYIVLPPVELVRYTPLQYLITKIWVKHDQYTMHLYRFCFYHKNTKDHQFGYMIRAIILKRCATVWFNNIIKK